MVLRDQGLEEKASRLMYERGQKTKGKLGQNSQQCASEGRREGPCK